MSPKQNKHNKSPFIIVAIISICSLLIIGAMLFWIEKCRFMNKQKKADTHDNTIREPFEDDHVEDQCEGNCRDYTLGYKPFDIRCRALDPVFNYWLFPNIMDTGCGIRPQPSCGTPCPTDCPDPGSVYARPLPVPTDIPNPF